MSSTLVPGNGRTYSTRVPILSEVDLPMKGTEFTIRWWRKPRRATEEDERDLNQYSDPWPSPTMRKRISAGLVSIRYLEKLPTELFHKILDDIPIIGVLRILSVKNPAIEAQILSHLEYQYLFNTRNVGPIIDWFILYRKIQYFCWRTLAPGGTCLYWMPKNIKYQDLKRDVAPVVFRTIQLSEYDLMFLESFRDDKIPPLALAPDDIRQAKNPGLRTGGHAGTESMTLK